MPNIAVGIATGELGQLIGNLLPMRAVTNIAGAFWNSLFANERLEPTVLLRLRLWQIIGDPEFFVQMKRNGYNQEKSEALLLASATYLDDQSIIRYGWRNNQSVETIADELVAHGWIKPEAVKLVESSKYYPTPADLITWQAREVFEPDMVQRYGLDAEFDQLELGAFHRAGMDDEQVRNFWRAHWEHPSWTVVQDMYHRGLMTRDQVYEWFRVVEVPPYWRDMMMQVSKTPYTRVDLRRMHKLGVLTDAQLKRGYMDIGYDDEKAKNLVDFTIKLNQESGEDPDRDLTRAMLEKAYRVGIIGRDELIESLGVMGYDKDKSEFISALTDNDVSLDKAMDWLSLLRSQVSQGLVTPQVAEKKMQSLGLSDESVEHYSNLFVALAEQPTKGPTKAEVKAFLEGELITAKEATKMVMDMGYSEDLTALYIKVWAGSEERYREWMSKMKAIARET